MKFYASGLITLIFAALLMGCGGDYRQEAVGGFGEAVVVMDSTQWQGSATAEAVRQTYGQVIRTLPTYESAYDLRWENFNSQQELDNLKRNKNLIIAAPLEGEGNTAEWIRSLLGEEVKKRVRSGESFAFPFENQWYRNQWAIVLTSTSDSALAARINDSRDALVERLTDKELRRWTEEIYDRGEKTDIEDSLMTNHGWMIRVQHDWYKNLDTTWTENGQTQHIVTMRRELPENSRWFWAWWREDVSPAMVDSIDQTWINTRRDSLMRDWVRGTRPDSYVTTEYRRDVVTERLELNGNPAWETQGVWRMTGDAMGGPFRTMTVYDADSERLFILEFGQFAPKYNKRHFVRQFRAMLRTFRTDSTWNRNTPMAAN
ncbi:MAG: DUF4837 family protein [Balneolaceae bacterium]|nr:DUF4837 family protein [Balneolaceae bacterium]